MKNAVFIATSLDGFIADKKGDIAFLDIIPAPEGDDMGYGAFMQTIDALVMGRTTFDTVCGFDIDWPFQKPVFVLSSTLTDVPDKAKGKVQIMKGAICDVLATIHRQGYTNLYIDGGKTVQGFLQEDLIDEMIITTIPIVLGGGSPLFGNVPKPLQFICHHTKLFANNIAQNHYKRMR